MRFAVSVSAVVVSCVSTLCGQSIAPAAAPTPSPAYFDGLVKAREQRAALLLTEIRESDKRIEDRIATIVDGLTKIQDSRDSRTQVAKLKSDTMAGLVKSIQTLQTRRAQLVEEIRRPTLRITVDQKKKIIAIFDAKIEKRVDQVLALQKSYPTYQEHDRYTAVSGGDYGPHFVQNESWRQNRRVSTQTDSQREQVLAGLKKSIDRLESQRNLLKSRVATAKSPLQLELINAEMTRIDALVAERRAQVADVYEGTKGGGRKISQREAADLDKTLQDAQKDLQRDINTLFQRYSQFLVAVSDLDAARTAAAAQK